MKANNSVTTFFNRRAVGYAESPFINYLFSHRETAALGDDDPNGFSILDLGCGTGRLYQHLLSNHNKASFRYLGLDPAEQMLAASNIPEHLRRIGDVYALHPEDGPFDRIYLLGVTTYLPDEVLVPTLAHLANQLGENGKLVVHYTNAKSIEVMIRQWLRPVLQRITGGEQVASAGFKIYPRSRQAARRFTSQLNWIEEQKLPASVPFLQHLSPRLAVWLSRRMRSWAPNWLRMDFMMTYQRSF